MERHLRACLWLLLATGFWGLSFPLIKSLHLVQEQLVPAGNSWFFSALLVTTRFGFGALVFWLWTFREPGRLTRLEIWQGLGLGVFGGIGVLIQTDGLAHTTASVSAFLTQFYCLTIPLWVAARRRQFPAVAVMLSSLMVLVGVAVLARFDLRELRIGRGETETLVSSLFFTAQILWLERPIFAVNRPAQMTLVMFVVIAVLFLPVALLAAPDFSAVVVAYSTPAPVLLTVALGVFCTVLSYGLMNYWQPHVTATEASLIYCVEPLCTALFALFLPALLSTWVGVVYPNETLTKHLLIGGGLITCANLLIQTHGARARRIARK